MSHVCCSFWKVWSDSLFEFFDGPNPPLGHFDGLFLSLESYNALCDLHQAIQEATGAPAGTPQPHVGGASPLPPEQEELLRSCIQQMLAGLLNDKNDPSPDGHQPLTKADWINDGNAETAPDDAIKILHPPGTGLPGGGEDLLGRIRSSLGA